MTEAALNLAKVTTDEYLDGEKLTPAKHEYVNGLIYAMGGASDKHGLIAGNLFASIHTRLSDSCEVFMSDMKLHINKDNNECYYYPDILVSCDTTDNHPYYRERPVLIIEVLSTSTERIDRIEKRARYQAIPELQEYVLVAQDFPRIEVYRRSQAWRGEEYFIEHQFRLESINMEFKVTDIYRRIKYTG